MNTELTGQSALLARKISKLKQHIEFCNSFSAAAYPAGADENQLTLDKMMTELEREQSHQRVVVFGTEHRCQFVGNMHNSELEKRLSFLKEQFAATVLLEEWSDSRPSFASTLDMLYRNVGTGKEMEFWTYPGSIQYPGYEGTLDSSEAHPAMAEYGPLENQESRERKMLENIRLAMESHDVGILVIGLAHVHSMSQKLLRADFNVAAFTWLPTNPQVASANTASPLRIEAW